MGGGEGQKGPAKERAFYELPDSWGVPEASPELLRKIDRLVEMIPEGVRTVLDVGCGTGVLTNGLAKHFEVIGCDWSLTALSYVRTPKVCASATMLPFGSGSVDLLLSSEVLEHLTEDDLQASVAEMLRLRPRFLLITIPNRENIHVNDIRCPVCGTIFNASHHMRSFTLDSLAALFPGYRVRMSAEGGPPMRTYAPWLLRIKQGPGKMWYRLPPGRTTMCPSCGNTRFPQQRRTLIGLAATALNRILSRTRPYWLFALFERTG